MCTTKREVILIYQIISVATDETIYQNNKNIKLL